MKALILAVTAALLAGCEPDCGPADEATVTGGSDTLGALIDEATSYFMSWSPVTRETCVAAIEVVADVEVEGGNALGAFDRPSRTILLEEGFDEGLRDDDVLTVITHELCHAADMGGHTTRARPKITSDNLDIADYDTLIEARVERFAVFCQMGPAWTHAAVTLAAECAPGADFDAMTAVREAMDFDDTAPDRLQPTFVGQFNVPEGYVSAWTFDRGAPMLQTDDRTLVVPLFDVRGALVQYALDVPTGAWAEVGPTLPDTVAVPWTPLGVRLTSGAAGADGTQLVTASVPVFGAAEVEGWLSVDFDAGRVDRVAEVPCTDVPWAFPKPPAGPQLAVESRSDRVAVWALSD